MGSGRGVDSSVVASGVRHGWTTCPTFVTHSGSTSRQRKEVDVILHQMTVTAVVIHLHAEEKYGLSPRRRRDSPEDSECPVGPQSSAEDYGGSDGTEPEWKDNEVGTEGGTRRTGTFDRLFRRSRQSIGHLVLG